MIKRLRFVVLTTIANLFAGYQQYPTEQKQEFVASNGEYAFAPNNKRVGVKVIDYIHINKNLLADRAILYKGVDAFDFEEFNILSLDDAIQQIPSLKRGEMLRFYHKSGEAFLSKINPEIKDLGQQYNPDLHEKLFCEIS